MYTAINDELARRGMHGAVLGGGIAKCVQVSGLQVPPV
jgi:hypothetical protein